MRRRLVLAAGLVAIGLAALAIAARRAHAPPARPARPTTRDLAVEVTATRGAAAGEIVLEWPRGMDNAKRITIRRRYDSFAPWPEPVYDVADGSTTRFVDHVEAGKPVEYWVRRDHEGPPYEADGFLYAGFDVPAVLDRGTIALVVERSLAGPLAKEIDRLLEDLEGDGYRPVRLDVAREDAVPDVKARIKALWEADKSGVRSVFLLGHVPVPYSGALAPDGHRGPVHGLVHFGAWPADLYYGEMDALWTDSVIDTRRYHHKIDFPANFNFPGDGKFDQTALYRPGMPEPKVPGEPTPRTDVEFDRPPVANGEVELEVGRVDFSDLPAFAPLGEIDLLRRYLDKEHAHRHGRVVLERRGLVADGFGYAMKEDGHAKFPFAAVAYRAYAAMFGPAGSDDGPLFASLDARPRLFAYAAGAGQFDACEGIGTTKDFARHAPQAAFLVLYGSYFGDWNTKDNFWRAALASDGPTVVAVWNSPQWQLHHLALGAPIGTSTRVTQNLHTLVHISVMGDPTLRAIVPPSPEGLVATRREGAVELAWRPVDGAMGYDVARAAPGGRFERLTTSYASSAVFRDAAAPAGPLRYRVRAIVRTETASGTFENPSAGAFATIAPAP